MNTREILPLLVGLVGIVILMAGAGSRGVRTGASIFVVIGAIFLLAFFLASLIARAN